MTLAVADWAAADSHLATLGITTSDTPPTILTLFPPRAGEGGAIHVPYDGSHRERVEAALATRPNYSLGFILNPGGTTNAEVQWCRALVVEDDGPAPFEQKKAQWEDAGMPMPTLQVYTGGKSVHHYWVLDTPCTPDEYRVAQQALSAHFQTALPYARIDTSMCKPAQVLRLAGGIHGKTHEVAEVCGGSRIPYALCDLMMVLTSSPSAVEVETREFHHGGGGVPYERLTAREKQAVVAEALRFCPQREEPGSGTYPDAFAIACALVHEFDVDVALRVARAAEWSQEHWDIEAQMRAVVDAPERRRTVWHIFNTAEKRGWKCPWSKDREVRLDRTTDDAVLVEMRQENVKEYMIAARNTLSLAEVFHAEIAAMLNARAESFPIAPTALLAPFLTTMAATIGKRLYVQPKVGWQEPMVLWMGTVAPASSLKTPVANQFLWPLKKLDAEEQAKYKEELRAYKAARKGDGDATPPQLPRQRVVNDATLEGLCTLLERPTTYGAVCFNDELSTFVGDMDRYRKGSSDRAHWLSMWSGGMINVLRKGSDPLFVPNTAVSVFGSIQQDKLQTMMAMDKGASRSGDGFWARFLWVNPPHVFPAIDLHNSVCINEDLMRLVLLLDTHGAKPTIFTLSAEAWELFAEVCNEWSRDAADTYPARAANLGKMRGYLARIAGLLHALDTVADGGIVEQAPSAIPLSTLYRAVRLCHFFTDQFSLLAPQLRSVEETGKTDIPAWVAKVVDIGKKKVKVTQRDLVRGYVTKDPAEARDLLRRMVRDYGIGRLLQSPRRDSTWWTLDKVG